LEKATEQTDFHPLPGRLLRSNDREGEVRACAVRMVFEHHNNYDSQSAAIAGIAAKIG